MTTTSKIPDTYEEYVQQLENEGCTTSDAQGIAMVKFPNM